MAKLYHELDAQGDLTLILSSNSTMANEAPPIEQEPLTEEAIISRAKSVIHGNLLDVEADGP